MLLSPGIRVISSPCSAPIGNTVLADDMKIRCDLAPAGMAKAAHATMQLYHENVLWLVAPGCNQILDCASAYQQFLDNVNSAKLENRVDPRVKNHEGHIYLTGKSEKTQIMDMIPPLGLIGSFLYHKCPTSTMTASPLISVKNRNNRMEAKYMNHHGFSAEFEELCRSNKYKTLEITKEIQNLVGVNDTLLAISRTNYVTMMQMICMDPKEVRPCCQILGGESQ